MSAPVYQCLVIGAGMSGICIGVELRRRGINDFLILESSPGVGGTWHDNTYPGACCDVPSVLYSFSFEANPSWSRKYSPHNEIRRYFEHCADKYGLSDKLRLNTRVESASYDEGHGTWTVALAGGEILRARTVVSALGQLNVPNIPDINGLEQFAGAQFHSARWDHAVDLRGKRVAIIGNAASALQFIPKVAEQAEQVTVYQRSANYIIPRNDHQFSAAQKQRFKRFPWLQKLLRIARYLMQELVLYPAMLPGGLRRRLVEKAARDYLAEQVEDPGLRHKLTPDYPLGCKRVLISDDYYAALSRPNVDLVVSPIEGVDEHGVISADGQSRPADVLIFGTGFAATEFMATLEVTGRDGLHLADAWSDGAEAYRGVAVSGFPNFFMLYGPNTNLGHNSIIFMVEQQSRYIARCIDKLLSHNLTELEVWPAVMRAYNDRLQGELAATVWAADCGNWYKNAAGRITNNWPGTTTGYWWHMRSVEFADFKMTVLDSA